ncbi:glycosyltransferase family 77 protein [Chrysochromulina tobinii]|uniref:Glycosyltransferase family 77 protein n=1 Tax=Chrysochromulina tobinii TaxID=1460289 RepID=A0A0M0LP13_9EUKA|nr:glycosyltransferase family 77 protein [Chrysochromulina tobinii]|eukprot:KOO52746.1 glycosyltransferase family 77 protein [Chrysochromulina sp. CCMP291]
MSCSVPPSGRLTPFYIFSDAKTAELRELGRQRVSTNEIIEYWRNLSEADRKPYEEKAAQACSAYLEECNQREESKNSHLYSRESVFAITKAVEFFLERCVWESARVTARSGRKTLQFQDVVTSMRQHHRPEAMQFFVEEFQPKPEPPEPNARACARGELSDALALAVPAGRGLVMLTFGNSGVRQMLINFVAHARAADIPFVVGAVDRAVFTLLARQSVAVYETPLSKQAGYALDGSNAHASGSWMSFAQMRSGEVARVVALGFDVLHTDVDVAWLRSPMPYLACAHEDADADAGATTTTTSSAAATSRWPRGAFSCASLKAADVAVSTDNMSPREEAANGVGYTAGGTFNTGLLLIRATAAGKRFARAWHASVVERACPAGRPGDCNPGRCCTSDQQVFNRMVRDEKFYPGLKVPHGGGRTVYSPKANVTLGALPLALFLHGHGYFVQSAALAPRAAALPAPFAVHATYSLDHHDELAKAQRFREAGLWRSDPPEPADARTLVLPRWACYCDRLWSGSDDIFHFGCMYPGAQDGQYVPFVCPMDHVLSPFEWNEKRFPYKDHLFLKPLEGTGEIVEIAVAEIAGEIAVGADGGGATKGGATEGGAQDDAPAATEGGGQPSGRAALRLPLGQSAVAVRRALAPYASARVLRLEHTRALLCGLGGAETFEADGARRLAQLIPALLKPPSWCAKCYQPCLSELKGWLDADTIRRGWRKEGGEEFWCAHFEPPEPLPALCPV